MPQRLPGMLAPRSEPSPAGEVERLRRRREEREDREEKKQQQDLISSEDSWSMSREREEHYRQEIEAQLRKEMAAEEAMRNEIEAQVRREMEDKMREEQGETSGHSWKTVCGARWRFR